MRALPHTNPIPRLLNEVFERAEILYLIERPQFRAALAEALEEEDFEELREMAVELLKMAGPGDIVSCPIGHIDSVTPVAGWVAGKKAPSAAAKFLRSVNRGLRVTVRCVPSSGDYCVVGHPVW
jgi:hypothetical protein